MHFSCPFLVYPMSYVNMVSSVCWFVFLIFMEQIFFILTTKKGCHKVFSIFYHSNCTIYLFTKTVLVSMKNLLVICLFAVSKIQVQAFNKNIKKRHRRLSMLGCFVLIWQCFLRWLNLTGLYSVYIWLYLLQLLPIRGDIVTTNNNKSQYIIWWKQQFTEQYHRNTKYWIFWH